MPNVNDIIKGILESNESAYLLSVGSIENRMLITYNNILTNIKNEIAKVYDSFGEAPTITQLRKFNRLQTIEQNLTKEIAKLQRTSISQIKKGVEGTMLQGYYGTGFAVSTGTNSLLKFGGLNKQAIKYALEDNLWLDAMKQNTAKLLTDVKREFEVMLRSNAREEIVSGLIKGKSLKQVQKSITERFGISMARAKVISQTEMHKSYMKGQATAFGEAKTAANKAGIKSNRYWIHNGIGDPRPEHEEADGLTENKDGLFNVGGELLEAPGLGSDPGNNINCHCTLGFKVDEEEFDELKTMTFNEIQKKFGSLEDYTKNNFKGVSEIKQVGSGLPPIDVVAKGPSYIPDTKMYDPGKLIYHMSKNELISYKNNIKNWKKIKTNTSLDKAYLAEQELFIRRMLKKVTDLEWHARRKGLVFDPDKPIFTGKRIPGKTPKPKITVRKTAVKKITSSRTGFNQPIWEKDFSKVELNKKMNELHKRNIRTQMHNDWGLDISISVDDGFILKDIIAEVKSINTQLQAMVNSGIPKKTVKEWCSKLNDIRLVNSKYVDIRGGKSVSGQTGGWYSKYTKHIEIGKGKPYAGAKPNLTLAEDSHNIDFSFEGIFRHEFGHHVDELAWGKRKIVNIPNYDNKISLHKLFINKYNPTKTFSNRWYLTRKQVSEYAMTNSDEFFAECFCAITSPIYGTEPWLRLPQDIENWFIKAFNMQKLKKRLAGKPNLNTN